MLISDAPLRTVTCSGDAADREPGVDPHRLPGLDPERLGGEFLEPASSISSRYSPCVRFWNSNAPVWSVVLVRANAVCTSVSVTLAPGRVAPLESLATPTTAP